jgi:putative flavoprotein involved in K+ transport
VRSLDVAVIGGGQAALSAGYYLRRTGLAFALFDASANPGGAWQHAWPSLELFSPGRWSSLPGWLMPPTAGTYPTRDETIAYLAAYEQRYALPVERPVRIVRTEPVGAAEGAAEGAARVATGSATSNASGRLALTTADGLRIRARAVISATGTWAIPVRPALPGAERFAGRVLHSAEYAGPESFRKQRVVVVGAGNSGAQIFADLVDHAAVTWATTDPPVFLPDDVDGQYLFDQATARYTAIKEGRTPDPPRSLGDIVMVERVRAVRDRGLLTRRPMFTAFTPEGVVWPDGGEEPVDAVIFATGFKPSLSHLAPLTTPNSRGRLEMDGLHAAAHPALFPLGYGDWTGFASATLIGAGRAARNVVQAVEQYLANAEGPPSRTALQPSDS